MRFDQSISDPDDPDSLSASCVSDRNSYPDLPDLNGGTEYINQDIEKDIPPLVVTAIPSHMPGLIALKQLQSCILTQRLSPEMKDVPCCYNQRIHMIFI